MNESELGKKISEKNAVSCFRGKGFVETLRLFKRLYNLVNDPEFDFSRTVIDNILAILKDESVDETARFCFIDKVHGSHYYFKCKDGLWCDVPKEVMHVKKPLWERMMDWSDIVMFLGRDKEINNMIRKERDWQNRRGCIIGYDKSIDKFYDEMYGKFHAEGKSLFRRKYHVTNWVFIDDDKAIKMLMSDDVDYKTHLHYLESLWRQQDWRKREAERRERLMEDLQEKGDFPNLFADSTFHSSMYLADRLYQALCDKSLDFNETVVDNIGFLMNKFADYRIREYFYTRILFSQSDVLVNSENGADTWSYIPDNELPVGRREPFEGCHICKRKWSPSKMCRKGHPCMHWRLSKTSRQKSIYGTKISDQYRVVLPEETKHMERMKDGKFSAFLYPYIKDPNFEINDEFIDKVKEFFKDENEKEQDNDKH